MLAPKDLSRKYYENKFRFIINLFTLVEVKLKFYTSMLVYS